VAWARVNQTLDRTDGVDENDVTVDPSASPVVDCQFGDMNHMTCDDCDHRGLARDFNWETGPKGTIPVTAEKQHFEVGDIVSHASGRICNGKYGVLISFRGELSVQDNEGGLDMPLKGHEHELTVVGNISENEKLLEEFV
jgi:hypothetical protein